MMDTSTLAHPKPEKRSTATRRKTRTEAVVVKAVRAACVERDGYCFLLRRIAILKVVRSLPDCSGPSEWIHIPPMTRAKTRKLPPEQRHSTKWTAMACRTHHDQIDGRRRPKLLITPTTPAGADGPIQVSVK